MGMFKNILETGADVFSAGGYSAAKERIFDSPSASYLAPINPIAMQSRKQREAEAAQRKGLGAAEEGNAQMARDMDARRRQDLDRTMGLYSPALQALEHLYGIPMSAWGEALPQNRPQAPARTGMFGGVGVSAAPTPGFNRDMLSSGVKPVQGLKSALSSASYGSMFQPIGRHR